MVKPLFQKTITESEATTIQDIDIPEPHWTSWGLGADFTVIDESVDPERPTSFRIAARFSPKPEMIRAFPAALEENDIINSGDSAYQLDDDVKQLRTNYATRSITLDVLRNAQGRLAGFRSEPIDGLTFSGAIAVARSVIDSLIVQFSAKARVPGFAALVYVESGDRLQRYTYAALPYPVAQLTFRTLLTFKVAQPFLSLYADGLRSDSVFYRFLCFFKIVDKLMSLSRWLRDIAAEYGLPPPVLNGVIPQDPFECTGAEYVGKKFTAVRDDLQGRYRNVIAHLDHASPVQPFNVEIEGAVASASMVLCYAADELLNVLGGVLASLQERGCNVNELVLPA